ncbi:REP element-mobilizing transposase RayT [Salinibacillus kushneri]|uniref:REP element-mobilizing transposase RayT n=1 Tax=Salinibacillus kushneri TaxID=237682 RepID=A0A1H9Z7F7_9BACI|nr:transposase [Salinibacillus kushneri]SES77486.1 REP element-mobilizing transposase RayT [Salinibacillus kushneri]
MGRKRRVWEPDFFYHIVCRGNRRDPLFIERGDFISFLYILEQVHEKLPFELAAYCLMTNHVHLQLRSIDQPISKVMAFTNKRYADYFNYKYKLTGHVFEKRYFDKVLKTDEGMLEVSRYIHQNPLKANIVDRIEDYHWSSLPYFLNEQNVLPPFMNTGVLLDYFSGSREKYRNWCLSPPEDSRKMSNKI